MIETWAYKWRVRRYYEKDKDAHIMQSDVPLCYMSPEIITHELFENGYFGDGDTAHEIISIGDGKYKIKWSEERLDRLYYYGPPEGIDGDDLIAEQI